jgi:hypothetical protein
MLKDTDSLNDNSAFLTLADIKMLGWATVAWCIGSSPAGGGKLGNFPTDLDLIDPNYISAYNQQACFKPTYIYAKMHPIQSTSTSQNNEIRLLAALVCKL